MQRVDQPPDEGLFLLDDVLLHDVATRTQPGQAVNQHMTDFVQCVSLGIADVTRWCPDLSI